MRYWLAKLSKYSKKFMVCGVLFGLPIVNASEENDAAKTRTAAQGFYDLLAKNGLEQAKVASPAPLTSRQSFRDLVELCSITKTPFPAEHLNKPGNASAFINSAFHSALDAFSEIMSLLHQKHNTFFPAGLLPSLPGVADGMLQKYPSEQAIFKASTAAFSEAARKVRFKVIYDAGIIKLVAGNSIASNCPNNEFFKAVIDF
jgi:hypothetical protein